MASNINLASVSGHVRNKLWNLLTQLIQFTDPTYTANKAANSRIYSFYICQY